MRKTTLIIMAALITAIPLAAQVSYVVPPGTRVVSPTDAPYDSWDTAATDIQTAINAAVAQGWTNVWVSNGTYYLDQQIRIDNAMTLRSWKDGELDREGTIVDGSYPGKEIRCFYLNHAGAVVRGFTIRNGFLTGSNHGGGAALYNNALLDNCLVISNLAYSGGGVYVNAGQVTNCVLANNEGSSGGGLYLSAQGQAFDCVISNNYAPTGGGIVVSGGTASNCVVTANSATSGGGAYVSNQGLLTHSRLTANTGSAYGGGLYILNAVARFCAIDANLCPYTDKSSNRGGGGLSVWAGGLVEDSVISNNVAYACGGGGVMTGGIIRRCLITDNDSGTAGQTYSGGGLFINASGEDVLLDSCQILRNRASTAYGGGILSWENGVVELRGCLIAANTAVQNGGGICGYRSILEIDNCTITDNHVETAASTAAAGFYSGYTNHCHNTIIYGNTVAGSTTRSNIYLNNQATISTFTNTCVAPLQTGSQVINDNSLAEDPLLDEAYELSAGSPCINAGVRQDWMDDARDLAGRSRLDRFSFIPDIGCFEYVPSGAMFRLR